MRNVSIQEFEERTSELVAEVEAGAHLTLIRGGKAVATMAPAVTTQDESLSSTSSLAEREAARSALLAFLDKGVDLGGKPFTYEERNDR